MGVIEFLKEETSLMEELFRDMKKEYKREVYDQLDKANITVLYGLRGTGKTTLLAQKYLDTNKSKLAIHGEHLLLSGYRIKDIIPSLRHIMREGYLFIDEITRLENWAEELKVLSDMYPKLKIIVSGSSAVDLQNARRTLARRTLFINLKPLTLNEFLKLRHNISISKFDPFSKDPLTSALKTELDLREKLKDLEGLIKDYRKMNLPYLMEKPVTTLLDVMDRVIYEDIGGIGSFNEDVLNKFWPLLKLLALSEKTSYDGLARVLGLGKGTTIKMIDYLIKANVVRRIDPYKNGRSRVRKEPKYLFTSPTIRKVLLDLIGEKERCVGLSREDMFAMHIEDELFYLKSGPDYIWKNSLFEVGGPYKDAGQFKGIQIKGGRFIVHEGLEVSSESVDHHTILKVPFYIFLSYF